MRLRKIYILFIFLLSIFSKYAGANAINLSTGVKANVFSNTAVILSTGNASGLICNGGTVKLQVTNGEATDISDYIIEWSTSINGPYYERNKNTPSTVAIGGSPIPNDPAQQPYILPSYTFPTTFYPTSFYLRLRYWFEPDGSRTEGSSLYSDPIFVQFYPLVNVTNAVLGGNDQSLCLNTTAASLTLSNTIGTTYLWQVSSNGFTGTYSTVATINQVSSAQSPTVITFPGASVSTSSPGLKYYKVRVNNGDGCTNYVYAYFTEFVKPNSTIQVGSGTSSQTVCINSALTDIVYTTTNVTSVRILSGSLPPGVTLGVYSTTATTTAQKIINTPGTSTNTTSTITASTTGQISISGTPTVAGTYTYTIVAEGNCASATTTGTITVNPNATIALQSGSATTTVCINNSITPIVYQSTYVATDIIITSGRLPGGLTGTFSNTSKQYTISGTATESGTFTYTVTTVGGCVTSSYTASITIKPDATIALIGGSSTTTVCVNTLITPIVYESTSSASMISIVAGGLPAGLTTFFDTNTKQFTISGTATQSGTFTYTIATAGSCITATTTGTITINPNATIALQSGSATTTICINNLITPIVYKSTSSTSAMSITGVLPAGLTSGYNDATKEFTISGTATQSGTFTYTIATAGICVTATTTGTITIKPNSTLTLIGGSATTTVCVGVLITPIVYESTSSATLISIVAGSLPAGLTQGYDNTTKQFTISGTATQSGTFTYTIATTGDCVTATTTGTITINPNATITLQSGSSTPTICINNSITPIVYKSTSSTSAMSIVAGGLPGGLTYGYDNINKTFTISGTATQSGTFTYTIATAGICVTATTTGTITIKPENTITLNSAVGTISQTVCINNSLTQIQYTTTGATGVNVTGLPAGVGYTWTSTTNILTITGSPTIAGTFSYTVTLTGGCASITTTGTITVTPDATINLISGTSTPSICINTFITPIVYSIGNAVNATITWATPPPAGINYSYNSSTKQYTISGTSSVSGTFNYTINAIGACSTTTSNGVITFKERTINSLDATDLCQNVGSITRYKVNNATTSSNATFTPSAGISNFTASYNPTTQILSVTGTPTNSGTYTFTVTSTDAGGCDPKPLTTSFTFTVKPDLSFTLVSGTPPVCLNTPITNIVYQINNVGVTDVITLASLTGLPNGVTGTYSATTKRLTISGTASESGVFNYQATINGGCTPLTITGTVNIIENRVYLAPTYSQNFDNLTTGTINTVFALNPATSATTSITANGTVGNGITFNNTTGNTVGNVKSLVTNLTYGVYEIDAKATSDASDQSFGILAQAGSFTNTAVTVVSRPDGTDNSDYTIFFMGNPVVNNVGPSPVYKSNWYKIKISYLPTELKVWIGSALVYTRDITNDVKYTSGAIMLSTYQTSVYDNLKYFPVDAGYTACINTAITPIVYETESSTNVSLVSGRLPGGLTGVFNGVSKQFVISGTATESGTFTYTLSSDGACATATTTGTITIKPDTEISLAAGSTATPTTCINTLLTPVVYNTNYANNAILTGTLPAGLSQGFNNVTKQFTISGTATQSGTFTYTITAYGDCASATTTGTITINPDATIALQSGSATTTICINNLITPIVYKSTSSSSGMSIVAGGLPAGLTWGYNNATKEFTISGTATQSGTFTYTIATAGICITATTTGTITIKPNSTLTLIGGSATTTVCVNTLITPIVYESTSSATLISIVAGSLPAGLTSGYNNTTKQFTISGTATQSGTFTYTIATTGDCVTATTTGTITINPNATIALQSGSATTTICINNLITPIVYKSTSSTSAMSIVAGGLPAGLTYGYNDATKEFTISGTATQSGTFTYTIATAGICVTATTTGTITIKPNSTLTLIGGSATTTVCVNTLITPIVYESTSSATLISIIGVLPAGLTSGYNNTTKQFTISGTATQSGTFTYTIATTGDCVTATTTGTITINPNATITLIQGTASNTICINNPMLTNVVYETTSIATDMQLTGSLPGGMTGTYSNTTKRFTITGTATESGTFTYTITTFGGCITSSTTGTITVYPNASIALTSTATTISQTVCINNAITPIQYTTVGATNVIVNGLPTGVSGTWTSTTNTLNITGAPSQSGTFTYTVIVNGNCISTTTTGTLTVNPNSSITLIQGSATSGICVNNALPTPIIYQTTWIATDMQLTGNLPAGLTGTYSNTTKRFTISGVATQSGTFTYTITTSGGCLTESTTGTITVDPATTINLVGGSATPTICINTPLTNIVYQTNYTASNIYKLSGNFPPGISGTYSATAYQYIISGTATQSGTFTYTLVTVGSCASSTTTGTITVEPVNTITPNGSRDATTCINTPLITPILYNTTGATGAIYSYVDQNNVSYSGLPPGLTGTNPITAGNISISGTPTVAGTFTYTVTLIGGCGSGTVSSNGLITVNPNNTITLSSTAGTNNQTLVCINTAIQNITYSTTSATGATISYTSPSGTYTSVAGLTFNFNPVTKVISLTGTPTVADNFDYTITLTGGCGNITSTGKIYVQPNKVVTLTTAGTNSQTLCIDNPIQNIQYTVTNGTNPRVSGILPTGVISNVIGSTLVISGTPSIAGTYNYTIIADGCGTGNATGTIVVNANSITLAAGSQSTQTACINGSITPIVYDVVGATTFNVTGLPAGLGYSFNPATSKLTISGTVSVTGTISYTIATTNGCNTVTTNGTINVSNLNAIALTSAAGSDNQPICINTAINSITYTTTGATGADFSYTLGAANYPGMPPGITAVWSNNVITITGTPTQAGSYTYHIELLGGCGIVSVDGTINTKINTISLISLTGDRTTCINTLLTPIRYRTSEATAIAYSYIDQNGIQHNGLPPGLTGSNPDVNGDILITGTPTQSGYFNYKITLLGGCGSGTVSSEVALITVTPENTIALTSSPTTNNQTVCINTGIQSITYYNVGATGTTETYTLNGGSSNIGLPPGLSRNWTNGVLTITGIPTIAGTYNYTIQQTGGCFPQTATGQIVVKPNASITLSSAPGTNNTQTPCINTAITSITYSTTNTNNVTISAGRLPIGLTQIFNIVNQTYTISGTPSETGTFTFTILAEGDCASATTTASITVKPNSTITLIGGTASNTICINNAITNIVYQSTFANTMFVNGNLPAGVTPNFNPVTKQLIISGTATQSGTFTFTVVSQGDCLSATATGTITVKPDTQIALTSSPTTNAQTPCINTAITNIVYATQNANTITLLGSLPPGVNYTFSATTQLVTITGVPTQSGTFTYTIIANGDCLSKTTTGTITVKPDATITLIGGTATNTICINTPIITPVIYRTTTSATDIQITAGGLPGGITGTYNPATYQFTISGTATQSGTFTYTLSTFGACVTATTTGTITVKPDTQIALTSSPTTNAQTPCINTSITNIIYTTQNANNITLTGLPPGVNYTFSTTTQLVTITGVPTQSGTFTYTIVAYGDCISATTSGTITVKPDATITLVGGTATNTICINTPIITPVVYRTTTSATDIRITAGGLPGGISGTYNPATYQFTISGTATQSGTFTYTLSTFGACVTATTTGTITVKADTQIALTSAPSTNAQSLCINTLLTNIQYTSQNANNVVVTGLPGGVAYTFSATTQLLTISGVPTVSGTFTYTIVASGDCVSSTTLGTIRVNENFINLVSANPIPITCINTSMTPIVYDIVFANAAVLTGTLPVGVSWNYNSGTKQLRITGTPTVAGTYTYTINTVDGCATKTVTASMTVQPDNTITLVSSPTTNSQVIGIDTDITLIEYRTTGATNVFATNLPAGIQQSWNAATNTFRLFGTGREVKTATYTVHLTGGCGIITAIGLIDVKPNNTITLSSTTGPAVCINTPSVNIVYKTTLATGATIVGLPRGLAGAWSQNGTDSLFTISGIATEAGNFNYTIQLTGGFGNISTTGSIRVDATTVPGTITASENLICHNSTNPTISLTGNTGNTIIWQYSTNGGGTYSNTVPIETGTSISSAVNNLAPGSVQVTTFYKAIVQSGVCPALVTNAVSVSVDPSSKVGPILPAQKLQEVCIGSPATNIVLPSNVGTIIWNTSNNATSGYLPIGGETSATLPSASIPTNVAGTIYYKAVVTSGVCPSIESDVASVQVDAASVAGNIFFLNGGSPICNQGVKPTISIANYTGNSIIWQTSSPSSSALYGAALAAVDYANTSQSGTVLNSAIDNTTSVLNSSFKYYRAEVKNGVCPAVNSTPIEIEVIPTPLVTSFVPAERCGPGSVQLSATTNLGNVSWFENSTGGSTLSTGNNYLTPSISANTNFYASGLYRGCYSLNRTAVLGTIKEVPTITSVADSAVCGPAVIGLSATASSGTINWYASSMGGTSLKTSNLFTTPLLRNTTTYYVDATLNGCTTVTRSPVVATIYVIPAVSPIADTAQLCVGNELSFSNNASLGLPPYVYTIYLDNNNVLRKSNETVIGIKSGYTTVYFNVKDMNGCVSVNSDAFKIKVTDPIVAQQFYYQAYYKEDFIIPTKKDTGYVLYNWTPPNNLNFINKPDPTFNGENPTDYVLLRTDTITKCAVADNYHIDVTRDFILELPNAFTPNNDGLNDEIKVVANAGIKDEVIVNIYNRSGKLIHQILRKTDAWDGKLNQVVQDADVYYWIADYETKTGQKRKKTGSFLLIK